MTKAIILNDGIVKNMTYEEIVEQFHPMIKGYARRCVEKFVFNAPEYEEVLQELYIQTWIAYERYNGINAFSTYLVPRLKHGTHKATQKLYAKKRTNLKGSISINEIIGGGDDAEQEFEALLGAEDLELESTSFRELMFKLEKILDPCEKLMLKVMLDKDDFSIRDLGDKLGMSRQGANKKYNKFKDKMAVILRETGYTTC